MSWMGNFWLMLFDFLKTQYGNPTIFITENGVSEKMMCTELCDDWRIQYYKGYINEMLKGNQSKNE